MRCDRVDLAWWRSLSEATEVRSDAPYKPFGTAVACGGRPRGPPRIATASRSRAPTAPSTWRSSCGAAEERNLLQQTKPMPTNGWRSLSRGERESQSSSGGRGRPGRREWRSSSGATKDRNVMVCAPWWPTPPVAVARRGDRGSQQLPGDPGPLAAEVAVVLRGARGSQPVGDGGLHGGEEGGGRPLR